jgi:hypothetical protein
MEASKLKIKRPASSWDEKKPSEANLAKHAAHRALKHAPNAKKPNEDLLELGSAAHPARRHTKKRSANHLPHIDDYIVVTARPSRLEEFRSKVREAMALGYQLQGGVSGDAHALYQALTKKVSSANDLLVPNADLLHLGAAAANNE